MNDEDGESEEEIAEFSHVVAWGNDEVGEERESERERMDRDYEEKCDRMLIRNRLKIIS